MCTILYTESSHTSLYRHMFQAYDHNQDLHSFPTRRSSDLDTANEGKEKEEVRNILENCDDNSGSGKGSNSSSGSGKIDEFEPFPDRKSTRLNSSHVSISYAVFCLKKNTH